MEKELQFTPAELGTERRLGLSEVPNSAVAPGPQGEGPALAESIPSSTPPAPAPEVSPPPSGSEEVPRELGHVPDEPPTSGAPQDRFPRPRLMARRPGGIFAKNPAEKNESLSAEQRLLILDTWQRSKLPAGDFSPLVGISPTTLRAWKARFEHYGPAGLLEPRRRAARGSRLSELTRRTILMLKASNPDWGCQRISDMLLRGPALPASPGAVARALREAGYVVEETPTHCHPDHPREFERARPNQLWQTDLFTFVLKRQNRRVYLVAYMDDHSRFIVGYGLHASASSALVIEVLHAAMASYQAPEEILTDNGSQYVTWRGKSAFSRELEKHGIRHVVSSPRHPQTVGKLERFWGSMWRECLEAAVFLDLADAQRRVGLYIDHHNFSRPHQGIGGMCPADRFFAAAPEVLRALKERAAGNALELARKGIPRSPFYLAGNAGGKPFSVHAEGERLILRREEGSREEIELAGGPKEAPAQELPQPLCPTVSLQEPPGDEPEAPGTSPLDDGLKALGESLGPQVPGGQGGGSDAPSHCA